MVLCALPKAWAAPSDYGGKSLGAVEGKVLHGSGHRSQIDEMTQHNAALVEESSAAAQSLQEQASRLSQVVGTFRLDNAEALPTPYAPTARAVRDTFQPA